jgi:hypothetical protein
MAKSVRMIRATPPSDDAPREADSDPVHASGEADGGFPVWWTMTTAQSPRRATSRHMAATALIWRFPVDAVVQAGLRAEIEQRR